METIKIDNMDDLEYCNKTLKTLFKKTTDIFETDISYSFRVFTDCGKRTILFYEFKKYKYCGGCGYFFHESSSEHGICDKNNKSTNCNSGKDCNNYKVRSAECGVRSDINN